MRYAVGSISKQFTAVAILLLQQEGKLKLDDPVSRFIPGLTRGNQVTVRQLLSHTSGYQDFWPQDYVMPNMLKPTTPQAIADEWAKKPLDFEPGSRWQYSIPTTHSPEWSSKKPAECRSSNMCARTSSSPLDSPAPLTSTSAREQRIQPATSAMASDHFVPRRTLARDGCGPPASWR